MEQRFAQAYQGRMRTSIIAAGIALVCAGAIAFSGCVNTIHAPGEPAEARMLYLLDLGRHTRVAFGRGNGEFVEYGYGEWLWYAKGEDGWWRVPSVILWPGRGTLGRHEWRGPLAKKRLLRKYAGLEVLALPAEEDRVAALVGELDRAFQDRAEELVRNERYGLDFVPYGRDYWLFHNSNHAVKDWLEAVGYEVSGPALLARWQLEEE